MAAKASGRSPHYRWDGWRVSRTFSSKIPEPTLSKMPVIKRAFFFFFLSICSMEVKVGYLSKRCLMTFSSLQMIHKFQMYIREANDNNNRSPQKSPELLLLSCLVVSDSL